MEDALWWRRGWNTREKFFSAVILEHHHKFNLRKDKKNLNWHTLDDKKKTCHVCSVIDLNELHSRPIVNVRLSNKLFKFFWNFESSFAFPQNIFTIYLAWS